MSAARRTWALAGALATAWLVFAAGIGGAAPNRGGTLTNPIDPKQQTALEFGERSFWLQPWRAYLETVPAKRLLDAVGINFNVSAAEAPATARLLADSGFRRARVEIGWGSLNYDDPTRLSNEADVRAKLLALKANGIRPLILLNANHGVPAPTRFFDARVVEPASRGNRTIRVDAATASAIVPGKTGLNALDGGGKAADVLFTAVAGDGRVTLSKPLPRDLGPGLYRAATLRFAPFGPPFAKDGSANPIFEETLRGWLDYVGVVTRLVRETLGNSEFDVELWNEVTFGSDFLDASTYYNPARETGSGEVTAAILDRTVAWLREPAHGVAGVGIGDGFASQGPWQSGVTTPRGLTAIDKHPYMGIRRFPQDLTFDGIRPVDALGRPDGVRDGTGAWHDSFVPSYTSYFPEYYLTATQTEHLVRDVSPFTTEVYGTPHGRETHSSGAAPPKVWITETNMDPSGTPLQGETIAHMQAKSALRVLTAYVNKGLTAIYFYAAKDGKLSLVDPSFFTRLSSASGAFPGDDAGGETVRAVGRLVGALSGAITVSRPRRLSLLSVGDDHDNVQFQGDGTAAHPPLYDRDVLTFFPYQVSNGRLVAAVYVMTRDVAKTYRPNLATSNPARYDLPPETFRLTIGGTDGLAVAPTASDPLTGASVPVELVSRSGGRMVIQLSATDSPRLLTFTTSRRLARGPDKPSTPRPTRS